jgi:hypothetical protein
LKRVISLMKLTVGMALLVILTTGCNVERDWISSRDPPEAEAQEEVQKQAAFFDIEGSPELDRATREYQDYVEGQSELLVERTEKFVAAVESGDVNKARTLYAPSRVPNLDPQQDRLHFASLDLMRAWSEAAAKMCAGELVGDENDHAFVPPEDTGEAQDLTAGRLTITFGFGPTLFEKDGDDRFGFASRKPAALREIPDLPGDNLDPDLSGGDLCVQACADDPQVAFHAVRNLARIGCGAAVSGGPNSASAAPRARAAPRRPHATS